jgi:hypothetical protein
MAYAQTIISGGVASRLGRHSLALKFTEGDPEGLRGRRRPAPRTWHAPSHHHRCITCRPFPCNLSR